MTPTKDEISREEIGTRSRASWGKLNSDDIDTPARRREHLEGISAETANRSPDAESHEDRCTMQDRGCGGKVEAPAQPGSQTQKKVWVMF